MKRPVTPGYTKRGLTTKGKATKVKSRMRDVIVKAMEARGFTAYRLAKEVDGKVTAPAVYDFVAGRSDMMTRFAVHLLDAVGLEIRPKE
jgi:hypothetical protein